MTTLSQYLQAEDPDWSNPDTFNLAHAERRDAPPGVRAIRPDAPTPYQVKMAIARKRLHERKKADALAALIRREQALWEQKLADDGLGPIEGGAQ